MKQKYEDVILALSRLRKIPDGPRFNMIFGHKFAFFDTNWRLKHNIEHYIVLIVFWMGLLMLYSI